MATVPTERGGAPPRAASLPQRQAPGNAGGQARRSPGAELAKGLAPALLIAGALCATTFYAKGGLELETMTFTEMGLTLAAGVLVALAALRAPRVRLYGLGTAGLLLAFTLLTAFSIVWSVAPDASFQDAGRMLADSALFVAAVALVRLVPDRWAALLGGITLAAVAVCGYALLTKVFPATLAASETVARLREPYGYWNALGLTAAMGALGCMWLGARRSGHGLLSALAYPAMGLMLLTLVLAYSRGALVALAIGLVLWFCIVPLRLRGAAVLLVSGAAAGAVAAWAFSRTALSAEKVPLAERTTAGHELGALIAAMVLLLTLAGIGIGFQRSRRAPSARTRRRVGTALLGLIAVAVLAFAGALAHSHRGFTGSISHAVSSLTNPNAKTPPNTPGRLTAVASVRARYWKEALEVFEAHPTLGAGAMGYRTARLRYRNETLDVAHAHGFLVQTLADLGLVGLVLALSLLIAWMSAAGRSTHPFNRRWTLRGGDGRLRPAYRPLQGSGERRYGAERIGLLTMLCVVVVFGAHSLADWTWYVPGDACVALLCAGWLAGRGPLAGSAGGGASARLDRDDERGGAAAGWRRIGRGRWALAGAIAVAVLLIAWAQWQPQRGEEAREQALALLASDPQGANAAARSAVSRDPLSPLARITLAEIQQATGHPVEARRTLATAVKEQPSNPETWLALGRADLTSDPELALKELGAAIYLNPESVSPELLADGEPEAIEVHNYYIKALAATAAPISSGSVRLGRGAGGAVRVARPRHGGRPARSRSPGGAR